MRSILSLCVVMAVVVLTSSAVVKAPTIARSNLTLGYISAYDRLLFRQTVLQRPVPNTVQYQDIVYRGNRTTRVSAIRAIEVGRTQNATVRVWSGGIGQQNVTLRVQSARGFGYHYNIDIWGR